MDKKEFVMYVFCKKLIEKGNYDKEDLSTKIGVFLLHDKVTQEEYEELIGMMDD